MLARIFGIGKWHPTADALHFAGFEVFVIEAHWKGFSLSALFLRCVVILDHLHCSLQFSCSPGLSSLGPGASLALAFGSSLGLAGGGHDPSAREYYGQTMHV